jgi:hypothetical protein
MRQSNESVAGAQAAAAIAGVVVLATVVPIFGIVMLPVVALAATGRGIAALAAAVGAISLLE